MFSSFLLPNCTNLLANLPSNLPSNNIDFYIHWVLTNVNFSLMIFIHANLPFNFNSIMTVVQWFYTNELYRNVFRTYFVILLIWCIWHVTHVRTYQTSIAILKTCRIAKTYYKCHTGHQFVVTAFLYIDCSDGCDFLSTYLCTHCLGWFYMHAPTV